MASLHIAYFGPMWTEKDNALYRKLQFADFSEAFAFMTRVALVAEKLDHHPRWTNVYNTVELWLSTHDAGDTVTKKDRELAKEIDRVLEEPKAKIEQPGESFWLLIG